MNNDPLLYDDELDAARDAVKAIGGPKKVGPMIWPDKTPDAAARHLSDCLNPGRPERLSPSQLLMLMRLAREVNFHGLAAYLLREAGYAQPVPVAPTLEAEVMANKLQHLISEVSSLAVRFERIQQQSTSKVLG